MGGFIPDRPTINAGLQADRPTFGQDKELYIATDNYSIYMWYDDKWLNIWSGYQGLAFDLNMNSNYIVNLARPQNDSDAATKKYVDDVVGGGTGDYQTFGKIDYGTQANRPAAGTDYRFYYETDTYRFMYDDGAAWNQALSRDHGDLAGLGDDDHSQYLMTNASRNMTGILERDILNSTFFKASSLGADYQTLYKITRSSGDEIDWRGTGSYSMLIRNVTSSVDLLTLDDNGALTINGNFSTSGSISGGAISGSSLDLTGGITLDGTMNGNHNSTTRVVLPVGTDKYAT